MLLEWTSDSPVEGDVDASEWTFRSTFTGDGSAKLLRIGGIATVADVSLNGVHLLHSENMFRSHELDVVPVDGENELVIHVHALAPLLAQRRPRPRWKTKLVAQQQLRWYRTTFLGRMPSWSPAVPPVGPWRPVELVEPPPVRVHALRVRLDGDDGIVEVETDRDATLHVGDVAGSGAVRVVAAERWWPHTHGTPTLHPVWLDVDGARVDLTPVGFRTIDVDTTDGDFRLRVNDVPIFARGGCWMPGGDRATLQLARDAGMNMVRLPGTMPYEDAAFWDACDELGILVWQDLAFANLDPPDDDDFLAEVAAEVADVLRTPRAALTIVCGGSEVEQQAAMFGLPPERRAMPLFDEHLPEIVARVRPDVPYVPNSPTGGDLPFHPNLGVAHYYGVSAYLRPLDDARRADVRFASECLAFAVPPERATVEALYGSADAAGHHPRWKDGVPRDNGASWDFEDVREHYVRELFGVDPARVRREDPERALDLGRAVTAALSAAVLSEWRRPGSRCAGGLLLMLRDLWPGAGWGVVDSSGRPKAPYWSLSRVLQPLAVLATDEGLNGLHLHVLNDGEEPFTGSLDIALYGMAGTILETVSTDVKLAGRDAIQVSADACFEGFRDLTYAYRFGPQTYDVIAATLRDADGVERSQVVHLPGGIARAVEPTVGLAVTLEESTLTVTTERFAQLVQIDVPGRLPSDSWFDLPPRASRVVELRGDGDIDGEVRALNSAASVRVR